MRIFPAIDLRGGQCVRLRQGDYAQETVFGSDPAAMARRWVENGATFLHLVDLDGAKEGRPCNGASVRRIVEAAGVPCQLGGGLRTDEHIAEAFSWGIARVVIGTRALEAPEWVRGTCEKFPQRVVLGLDARDGFVATDGWLTASKKPALELARACDDWPLGAIVYTDIGRDGMLSGPNGKALAELATAVRLPIIASGGIRSVEDVRRLSSLRLAGCIIGRALYEGKIDLAEAIREAERE